MPKHEVPEWVSTFKDTETAKLFVAVAADVIEQRWGPEARFDAEVGLVTIAGEPAVSLANPARFLAASDISQWRPHLYNYLSLVDSINPAELVDQLRDWEYIQDRLRVRLYRPLQPELAWGLVSRPVSPSTLFAIAADLSVGATALTPQHLDRWDVPVEEVWRRAIANTASSTQVVPTMLEKNGFRAVDLHGDLFTSGLALDLSLFLPPLGQLGALLSAPCSDTLLVMPIASVNDAAQQSRLLVEVTLSWFNSEPHPLSPSVFWYRGPQQLEAALEIPGQDRPVELLAPEPLNSWLQDEWSNHFPFAA